MRESVPGYLFAVSTLALAVVLYLGYASFFLLKAVCVLCLTTYAAVIGLFLVSGAATSFPMTTLPRRAAAGCPRPRHQPARDRSLAVLFFAGAASTLAFFPREAATGGRPRRRAAAAADAGPASELERFMASAPRVPLVVPADGAKVLIVKFNDFQCPPAASRTCSTSRSSRSTRRRIPAPVKLVMKDYPLNPTATPTVAHDDSPGGVRCGRGRAAGAAAQARRGDGGVALHAPAGDDAADRSGRRRATSARSPTSTRSTQSTLELVKGDIALGQQLGVQSDADLLHQRRQDRRRVAAAVLRSGDRATSCSTPREVARFDAGACHLTS